MDLKETRKKRFAACKELREELGLTQMEFCEAYNKVSPAPLHITNVMLSRYESGTVDPQTTVFFRIQDVLNRLKNEKIKKLQN